MAGRGVGVAARGGALGALGALVEGKWVDVARLGVLVFGAGHGLVGLSRSAAQAVAVGGGCVI